MKEWTKKLMTEKQSFEVIKQEFLLSDGKKLTLLLEKYRNDPRVSVQNELRKISNKLKREETLKENYEILSRFENDLQKKGFEKIAGVDEAGRGSLAGPLVAAAVILPQKCYIEGLKECKQLLHEQRKKFFFEIKEKAIAYSIIEIGWTEIDEIGLHKANLTALQRAATGLNQEPDFVLSDGFKIETPFPGLKIINGDRVSASIAAASILAKVHRDKLMDSYHASFPDYNFNKNKGYGTKDHMEALKKLGPSSIHRQSFKPVRLNLEGMPKL